MRRLDRDGIFKAYVMSWSVKALEGKLSVAVSIQFRILAQLTEGAGPRTWQSWDEYEEHNVWGDFWIIGKTGNLLIEQIEKLSSALNWNGDLKGITLQSPPQERVCQITVKGEDYKGQTQYKASWIQHKDFSPGKGGKRAAREADVMDLHMQYGSQIRAALGASAHNRGKPDVTRKTVTPSPPRKAAPPSLCPVTPEEGAEPIGNQDPGNPFDEVPDEAASFQPPSAETPF